MFEIPRYLEVITETMLMAYRGIFALEYAPTLESTESLRKTLEYLKG